MNEIRTISRDKQSSLLGSATEDENFVAQILIDLPNIIRKSESLLVFKWGNKKRRSRLDEGASSSRAPSSYQMTDVGIEERKPRAKAEEEVVAAASPVTPLSFPASESDEKSWHAFRKSSNKRSREEYMDMIEELTKRRNLLRGVLNSCIRKEEPEMEIRLEMNLGMELTQNHQFSMAPHQQPLFADEKFQNSLGPITAQFYSSYSGLGSVHHVGPLGIPDLNLAAGEVFGVDPYQPLDVSRDLSDKRARFAEARRRRSGIIKIKSMRRACGIKLPGTS
ncbi:hypothetical protein DH2020_034988 [Rehmannia glutinosa]|uniref:Uncharacterized protein n=1 Tax=Rehmannia glutinosa TaxID=99300 RepID=A0ABR0V8P2_REHGL